MVRFALARYTVEITWLLRDIVVVVPSILEKSHMQLHAQY